MKQTMLLKLAPTKEQHHALLETMHAFNAAATYVAEIAFGEKTANKFELQKLVYGELRKLAASKMGSVTGGLGGPGGGLGGLGLPGL